MTGFAAMESSLAGVCMRTFGEPAVLRAANGQTIGTRAQFDSTTYLGGHLGDAVDPRPSVKLPVADVGAHPTGTLTMTGKGAFDLDRPIDGSNDGYIVRVWVTPK